MQPSQEWFDEVFGQHFPPVADQSRGEDGNYVENEHNKLTPQPPSGPPPTRRRPPATPTTSWLASDLHTVSKATAMQPPTSISGEQSQKALAILSKAVSDLAALHINTSTDSNQS